MNFVGNVMAMPLAFIVQHDVDTASHENVDGKPSKLVALPR